MNWAWQARLLIPVLVLQYSHHTSPAGAAAGELCREAGHLEAEGLRQLIQISQLFYMAVFLISAGEVRAPQQAFIARPGEILFYRPEGPVPAPGIDTHDPDSLVYQPQRRLPGHAAARIKILCLAPQFVGTCLYHDDIPWLHLIVNFLQGCFKVIYGNAGAARLVPHIQHHAIVIKPFQWHFVYGPGSFPF